MCGFSGVYHFNGSRIDIDALVQMCSVLKHRGPDDEGYLLYNTVSNEALPCYHTDTIPEVRQKTSQLTTTDFRFDLAFGFRRLSIIDLSANGHQPMRDDATGNWIVFNGEIYNYLEIRGELKKSGYDFRSDTDTEVILKAYSKWGRDCVHQFNGMWAFAIWDVRQKVLFCSRDRFGIKPFYYYHEPGKLFAFASEIKALLKIAVAEADYDALHCLFTTGFSDNTENTFFRDILQLRGSHSLLVRPMGELKIFRYYDIREKLPLNKNHDSIDKFRELFFDSVKLCLRSDVPLGYALSGGVDSSSVVVAANQITGPGSNNLTFSTVYPGEVIDESRFIDSVIRKTGFRKNCITPTSTGFLEDLEKFTWHHEEPYSGIAYYAEYALRRLTKLNGVTVSLEGQGADEIISGYVSLLNYYLQDLIREFEWLRFFKITRQLKARHKMNLPVLVSNLVGAVSPSWLEKLKKYYFRQVMYPFIDYEILKHQKSKKAIAVSSNFSTRLNQTMYDFLLHTSIPVQLNHADKNAMAFSVECRFPFLDHRLVEFAFSLDAELKINNGTTKYILREAMKNFLPAEVYNRQDKLGFPVPIEQWVNRDLKGFINDTVATSGFKKIPFLKKKPLMKYMIDFNSGKKSGDDLWTFINVFLWHNRFKVSW